MVPAILISYLTDGDRKNTVIFTQQDIHMQRKVLDFKLKNKTDLGVEAPKTQENSLVKIVEVFFFQIQ